jgi:hypothetical protein
VKSASVDWNGLSDVLRIASEFERVHALLSSCDGDPNEYNDMQFASALTLKLMNDPARLEQLRRLALEFALKLSH